MKARALCLLTAAALGQSACVAPGTGWRSDPALCRSIGAFTGGVAGAAVGSGSNRPLAEELLADPDTRVDVVGHTDSVGSDDDDLDLSQSRAEAVRGYLVRRGIDASRLSAQGRGESDPERSNATTEGRAQNRRVELVVH